jgi:N,N'-diacetyllegionaminate synthase
MSEQRVFVIAEIGVNHDGDIEKAKELIDRAAFAKADAVKFQSFSADRIATKNAPLAHYQTRSTSDVSNQYQMLKRLELKLPAFKVLSGYAQSKNLEFISTPFDIKSARTLGTLGVRRIKLSSGDINNLPLLREISHYQLPVILSTGMSFEHEVAAAIQVLVGEGITGDQITIMQCNTEYPTPHEDVNLNAMISMRDRFLVDVGYSDHTIGIEAALAATSLGAKVIEKHLTLDRKSPGPDHTASTEPEEFKTMVAGIRLVETMMGNAEKRPTNSEAGNIEIARKSIVASRPIKAGERFDATKLTCKRPGSGISPMSWDSVVGLVAMRDFAEDEPIEVEGV